MASVFSSVVQAFKSPAPLVSWFVITVALTVSGTFGAIEPLPLSTRILLFATLSGMALIYGIALRTIIMEVWKGIGYWTASHIVILSGILFLTWPIHWIAHKLVGVQQDPHQHTLGSVAVLIFVLGYCASIVRWLFLPPEALPTAASPTPEMAVAAPTPETAKLAADTGTQPRLLARLPEDMRGTILRVSGSNHHIEVVTDKGTTRLLMRLSDALSEIETLEGFQTHRSHWVAAAAVTGVERDGERRSVVLKDGARIPVSRGQRAELERRGLI